MHPTKHNSATRPAQQTETTTPAAKRERARFTLLIYWNKKYAERTAGKPSQTYRDDLTELEFSANPRLFTIGKHHPLHALTLKLKEKQPFAYRAIMYDNNRPGTGDAQKVFDLVVSHSYPKLDLRSDYYDTETGIGDGR